MTDRVELVLTSPDDTRNTRYVVLVNALEEYAGQLEHQAEERDKSDAYNGHEPDSAGTARWRADAAVARELIEEIEQQLDA